MASSEGGTRIRGAGAARALLALAMAIVLAGASADAAGAATVIASDTAANPDPVPFWGQVECEHPSRQLQVPVGGDPHSTITGAPQPDTAYRQMTLLDGDDFYGERCELGDNFRKAPTAFYREGKH